MAEIISEVDKETAEVAATAAEYKAAQAALQAQRREFIEKLSCKVGSVIAVTAIGRDVYVPERDIITNYGSRRERKDHWLPPARYIVHQVTDTLFGPMVWLIDENDPQGDRYNVSADTIRSVSDVEIIEFWQQPAE